jgi:hypothetical protein
MSTVLEIRIEMIKFHTKKIWGFHDGEVSYCSTVGYGPL